MLTFASASWITSISPQHIKWRRCEKFLTRLRKKDEFDKICPDDNVRNHFLNWNHSLTNQYSETSILSTAWEAFYKNRYAALILWAFGIGVVASYFSIPWVQFHFQTVGAWKSELGWAFSAISTGIFGGVGPIVFERLVTRPKTSFSFSAFVAYAVSNFLFWAVKGVEIDFWYQFQGILWGNEPGLGVIAGKTFLDQFVYVPVFGIVNAIWFYRWRDANYRLGSHPFTPSWTWYKKNVIAILVSNWFVWVPSVVMIYCLPINLQLPIQNLILCLWVMMLSLMAKEEAVEEPVLA